MQQKILKKIFLIRREILLEHDKVMGEICYLYLGGIRFLLGIE